MELRRASRRQQTACERRKGDVTKLVTPECTRCTTGTCIARTHPVAGPLDAANTHFFAGITATSRFLVHHRPFVGLASSHVIATGATAWPSARTCLPSAAVLVVRTHDVNDFVGAVGIESRCLQTRNVMKRNHNTTWRTWTLHERVKREHSKMHSNFRNYATTVFLCKIITFTCYYEHQVTNNTFKISNIFKYRKELQRWRMLLMKGRFLNYKI